MNKATLRSSPWCFNFQQKIPTSDRTLILGTFAVKVLVSSAAGYRSHRTHPKVIAVNPDGADGLLEGNLDFETHSIEADDIQRVEGKIGGKENPAAAMWMNDALVNAAGQRKPEEALGGLADHGDGLARVTKNKPGFGIVLRFLMKLFDRRHLNMPVRKILPRFAARQPTSSAVAS